MTLKFDDITANGAVEGDSVRFEVIETGRYEGALSVLVHESGDLAETLLSKDQVLELAGWLNKIIEEEWKI